MHKAVISILALLAMVACGHGGAAVDATVADSTATASPPDTITLALVGDIMLGTTYPTTRIAPNDARDIFNGPDSLLRAADLACGNLEGALADEGKPRKTPGAKGSFSFLMPTRLAQRLVDAGFDFLGIANNHVYDFSEPGRQSTMKTLKEAGLAYSGNETCRGVVLQVRDKKVGLCQFGHSIGTQHLTDTALVRNVIDSLKRISDVVVVAFHGGNEGSAARHLPHEAEWAWGENRGYLRQFTHDCIDWGADVVYGHGPHVVRAMEVYKGRFIAYSLGNFCTPSGMGVAGLTGYAPLVTLRVLSTGEMVDGRINGFVQTPNLGPRRDRNGVVVKEIATLSQEDFPDNKLTIAPDGKLTPRK